MKKKKNIIITSCVIVVAIISIITLSVYELRNNKKETKKIKNIDRNSISEDVVEEDSEKKEELTTKKELSEQNEEDNREVMVSDIVFSYKIMSGDRIDLRIQFPNGEDYVVLANKIVRDRDEQNMFLDLNEYEMLNISSAQIDCKNYEGARLYVVRYLSSEQQPSSVDYPMSINNMNLGMWTPNMPTKEFFDDTANRRLILEQNLNTDWVSE